MNRPYRPRVLRRAPSTVVITARQAEVLDGLCDGLKGPTIAARIGTSHGIARKEMSRLYRALGAGDRAHAVGLVLTGRVQVLVNDPREEPA